MTMPFFNGSMPHFNSTGARPPMPPFNGSFPMMGGGGPMNGTFPHGPMNGTFPMGVPPMGGPMNGTFPHGPMNGSFPPCHPFDGPGGGFPGGGPHGGGPGGNMTAPGNASGPGIFTGPVRCCHSRRFYPRCISTMCTGGPA